MHRKWHHPRAFKARMPIRGPLELMNNTHVSKQQSRCYISVSTEVAMRPDMCMLLFPVTDGQTYRKKQSLILPVHGVTVMWSHPLCTAGTCRNLYWIGLGNSNNFNKCIATLLGLLQYRYAKKTFCYPHTH